jgi:hypothetical protein
MLSLRIEIFEIPESLDKCKITSIVPKTGMSKSQASINKGEKA